MVCDLLQHLPLIVTKSKSSRRTSGPPEGSCGATISSSQCPSQARGWTRISCMYRPGSSGPGGVLSPQSGGAQQDVLLVGEGYLTKTL